MELKNRFFKMLFDEKTGLPDSFKIISPSGEWSELLQIDSPYSETQEIKNHPFCSLELLVEEEMDNFLKTAEADNSDFSFKENEIKFTYRFNSLPGFRIETFFLQGGPDRIIFKIQLINSGKKPLTIKTAGINFPFANKYYGFGKSDTQMEKMYKSRYYLHKYIGGASGYLLVQRLDDVLSVLVSPGEQTAFEAYSHHPWSLKTGEQWEGLPVIYLVSAGIKTSYNGQNENNSGKSVLLNRNSKRSFTINFTSLNKNNPLLEDNKVVVDVHPAAALPVESTGRLTLHCRQEISDLVFSKKASYLLSGRSNDVYVYEFTLKETGENICTVVTANGEKTYIHLYGTPLRKEQIFSRAGFICDRQVETDPDSDFYLGIFPYNHRQRARHILHDDYWGCGCYEGGITDAMYLAEKNSIYPDEKQVKILEEYINRFLLEKIQNPVTFEVAWIIRKEGFPDRTGRFYNYAHVFNLYHSMYKTGKNFNILKSRSAKEYLVLVKKTIDAMFRYGWKWYMYHTGMMNGSNLFNIITDLKKEGMTDEAESLTEKMEFRFKQLLSTRYPYSAEPDYDTTGYEDVYFAAKYLDKVDFQQKTLKLCYACRPLIPSWWWNGSDRRFWDAVLTKPYKYMGDMGENCLHYTTSTNSLLGIEYAVNDHYLYNETYIKKAFAGFYGIWALAGLKGNASMCYTPDISSDHYGFVPFTGDTGLSFYTYLRGIISFIDITKNRKYSNYGCELSSDDEFLTIVPNNGVNRKIVIHFMGVFEIFTSACQIKKLIIKKDRSECTVILHNQTKYFVEDNLTLSGIGCSRVSIAGSGNGTEKGHQLPVNSGRYIYNFSLKPEQKRSLKLNLKK